MRHRTWDELSRVDWESVLSMQEKLIYVLMVCVIISFLIVAAALIKVMQMYAAEYHSILNP